MTMKHRKWRVRWAVLTWVGLVLALYLAAACNDVTVPRVIPGDRDTTGADSTAKHGFLTLPGTAASVFV